MLDQRIAQEVIDCALSTGGDFAEIFYEDRLNNGVMMRSGKVESINSGRLHGAGVRVYLGLGCMCTPMTPPARACWLAPAAPPARCMPTAA